MKMFEKNEFLAATLLSMLLCAAPFFVVDWLPMIDLPNHLAQAHLVGKVLSANQPDMLINWLSPDTLTTWVLALLLLVLSPLLAAKAMVLGLILLSIAGIALLARKIGAGVIVVPLSAGLLFNQSFYWGFLPFIAGFAAFLFLMVAWLGLRRASWRGIIFLALLFLLVYFCHILWFAVAALAVLLSALASPERSRKWRVLVLAALPAVGLALFWYPAMHNNWMSPSEMAPYWVIPLLVRLRPDYVAFCISGLNADFKIFLLVIVLLFIFAGIAMAIFGKRRMVSVPLFLLALLLLAAYLALPDKYNNTVLFAVRWLPYALIFFLLGCLAPIRFAKRRIAILLVAFIVLGSYALLTAHTWNSMEKEEWSGLMQAMEKLPPRQTVLGLDFIRKSARINSALPFATGAAYAQALRDCEVNFSFAEHASSLVTYKTIPTRPYQRKLNIFSQMVNRTDVGFFNFVLVNADEVTHDKLAEFLGITPVTHEGRWRLYEVGRSN
ncbi:MAG: hypothetical protein WB870_11805 [Gallionellaceae bacterium]